jgi:hypothetical protein
MVENAVAPVRPRLNNTAKTELRNRNHSSDRFLPVFPAESEKAGDPRQPVPKATRGRLRRLGGERTAAAAVARGVGIHENKSLAH